MTLNDRLIEEHRFQQALLRDLIAQIEAGAVRTSSSEGLEMIDTTVQSLENAKEDYAELDAVVGYLRSLAINWCATR